MREPISACIITFNEERKIERCLRSVAWCDEIVVLDSFSTDRTLDICRRYTDRVCQNTWLGYVGQRNRIREMARGPWILFLDSDEEVTDEFVNRIRSTVISTPLRLGCRFSHVRTNRRRGESHCALNLRANKPLDRV